VVEYFEVQETGSRFRFDHTDFLKTNQFVVTIEYSADKTESRVIRDVHRGICHALSLRFIETRIIGERIKDLDRRKIIKALEDALKIIAVQQSMIKAGKKSGEEAGGIEGTRVTGSGLDWLFSRPFNSLHGMAAFLQNNRGLYEHGMYGNDG